MTSWKTPSLLNLVNQEQLETSARSESHPEASQEPLMGQTLSLKGWQGLRAVITAEHCTVLHSVY